MFSTSCFRFQRSVESGIGKALNVLRLSGNPKQLSSIERVTI